MARRRKPTALKLMEGTDRSDRRNDAGPEYEATVDSQPPWPLVNAEAIEFWNRIVPLLESQRVLTEIDLDKLAHLANYHGKIRQIWDLGGKPTAPEMTQLRISMTEFGMTPASRAKVSKSGAPEKVNAFKKFDRSGS